MKPFLFILIAFSLIALIVISIALADELQCPFSCYPRQLQAKLAEHGLKLDLDGNDRDENSWGFLRNEGTQFKIFTYKSLTNDELVLIQKLVMEE